MGRAERRRAERKNRIEDRKGKILMTPHDIREMKRNIVQDANDYKVEALMTCFMVANNTLWGHDADQCMQTLGYIDDMMGEINEGLLTFEELKKLAEDKIGVAIVCKED